MPVRGHVGSDYERLRPEFRVIPNPWSPSERIMLVPPIAPDVALIHAIAATGDGTLLLDHMEDDALLAQASRAVVASTERIVAPEELRRGDGLILQGIHVTALDALRRRDDRPRSEEHTSELQSRLQLVCRLLL